MQGRPLQARLLLCCQLLLQVLLEGQHLVGRPHQLLLLLLPRGLCYAA
jgi:hypothetical protein